MKIFGPVPSRRLGMSLGVNNIPYKICTYSCVYCQIGRAVKMQAKREVFYPPEVLLTEVKETLAKTDTAIDYITIVPDGEPTLDLNLGRLIEQLGKLGIPVAVITNASLLHLPDVREELARADWVSVKIDTVKKETWKRVDRPFKTLDMESTLEAIGLFADAFSGKLATETMLVAGMNDTPEEFTATADFIKTLKPLTSFLAVPVRPPAVRTIRPPDETRLNEAYQIFSQRLETVEYLTGYEGNGFASTGDAMEDILSITAVHPMREDAVRKLLLRTHDGWEVVENLLKEGKLQESSYNGHLYYLRRFTK